MSPRPTIVVCLICNEGTFAGICHSHTVPGSSVLYSARKLKLDASSLNGGDINRLL